jgi:hypothetical protein
LLIADHSFSYKKNRGVYRSRVAPAIIFSVQ